ncbi:probable cytochrome P450 9f2 [Bradysia coprophila]|uniref:probable cytochrome P450 9f2 n=1 Tax=Bradysia coprophila TaxID=38358 RepID=UPI00187DB354|nr:probable cytochrome P450 9f2 [Bradysia coprophila]
MIGNIVFWMGIILIVYAFYKWLTIHQNYFRIRNIPYWKPKYFFGNNIGFMMLQGYPMCEFMSTLYAADPGTKILGAFNFRQPNLVVRDPDVIKQLLVKDFDHFEDHTHVLDDKVDVLFGNSLFFLTGSKWRDMRSTLSPAFTGSKIRQMFDLLSECGDQMVKALRSESESTGSADYEMKELFGKYSNDVISSVAFGCKIDSFVDPSNDFYLSGKKFAEFGSGKALFRVMTILMLPRLASLLGISIIDRKVTTFFRNMVLDNIAERERQGIYRPDMINILMNVKKGNSHLNSTTTTTSEEKSGADFASVEESSIGKKIVQREWTDDEIVAQCFGFFLAAFDTSSIVLSFVAYELSVNQNVQQKLYDEIEEMQQSLSGKQLAFENIQGMKYMDQVISETLRHWPPAPGIDRVCVKDYSYDDGEFKFKIDKGTTLLIPVYGLHFDEKYWDNPREFRPERFSDENKDKIVAGSFGAFGMGPRSCIGSRFALIEVKSVIYHLLLHFKFEPNEKSQIPLKLKSGPVGLTTENGIHVALKRRT